MPLVWKGQLAWELEQEMNIKYVALTRSLNRLIIAGNEGCLEHEEKPVPNAKRISDVKPDEEELPVVIGDVTDLLPPVTKPESLPLFAAVAEKIAEPVEAKAVEPTVEKAVVVNEPTKIVELEPNASSLKIHEVSQSIPVEATSAVEPEPPSMEDLAAQLYKSTSPADPDKPRLLGSALMRTPISDPTKPLVTGNLSADLARSKRKQVARSKLESVLDSIHDVNTIDTLIELLQARKEMLEAERV
jgi:ATP-dependent exoDNAse (exonuclease V) beta subunit